MAAIDQNIRMHPIALGNVVATAPEDLVSVVTAATDAQVEAKGLIDPDVRADFALSCDALNYTRLAWRCAEEWKTRRLDESIGQQVRAGICASRRYDPDDFNSAIQATSRRVRLPYGWTAISFALRKASENPIRLLHPELAGKRVPTTIANIALMLATIQDGDPILLPIDQLRGILQQRKIVISGAVQRLVEAGVLEFKDMNYRTGKAREFRFTGKASEHFAYEEPPANPE